MNRLEAHRDEIAKAGNPFEDVDTAVQEHAEASAMRSFVLRIEAGAPAARVLRIDETTPSPLLVGSSQVCALQIHDARISRRHFSLEPAERGLRLRDLDSTNGTHVENVQVVEAVLEGGERIEIGSTVLRLERDRGRPAAELSTEAHFHGVFGASVRMRQLYPLFARLASSQIPIVLEGETGTGKEAVAEAIHAASPRAAGPFVVFDCTAAAQNLLESDLFGHERGAFTGAVGSRLGAFQQAQGGTLLIDEIGDLDLGLQPKLLRAIERMEVRPLGATHPVRVDVRLMAATRRDLDREVQDGRFRDDLFHRLAVARVELPPLRKRLGDISVLARHFWGELSGDNTDSSAREPPAELIRRWERDPWPGNVRQLRNAVARVLALGDSMAAFEASLRAPADSPLDFIEQVLRQRLPLPVARERVVHEFERRYLDDALRAHEGNVTHAARDSGIALRYFQLLRSRRKCEEPE
jgi:DNA-binding NtrC family response regulator